MRFNSRTCAVLPRHFVQSISNSLGADQVTKQAYLSSSAPEGEYRRSGTDVENATHSVKHIQIIAHRQISSTSGTQLPASAAARRTKPVEQPLPPVSSSPRDTALDSGLFRIPNVAPALTGARVLEFPHVSRDQRKVSVGWKSGILSRL
jgi:hypothetical protein